MSSHKFTKNQIIEEALGLTQAVNDAVRRGLIAPWSLNKNECRPERVAVFKKTR